MLTIKNIIYSFKNLFIKSYKSNYIIVLKETIIESTPEKSVFNRPLETFIFTDINEVISFLKQRGLTRPSTRSFTSSTYYSSPINTKPKISAYLEKGFGSLSKKLIYRSVA